ncbi:GNAT family N-acetyltransferase [Methanoculleus sediminis]|uniref:GNAT family N-acetyltransferase n=1 Tax=Methanoculleus sediminis TaxID=1550566 RepID=UPI00069C3F24|nr:GNAT family N-acetyltransferase [Methanoculleus sediminis]
MTEKDRANRQIYIEKDGITLLYAEPSDRRFIYEMAFEEPEIWQSMLAKKDDFDWSELRDEEDHFFGSVPGKSKYLLIQYRGEIIGTISHTCNNGRIENLELDMWLRSTKYTGKGIGPAVIAMLIDRLVEEHGIRTFIVRPWLQNARAARAYEKCGFRRRKDFVPSDYYGEYLERYGEGDYGTQETVNMVLEVDR